MRDNNILLKVVLIITCILSVALNVSLYRHFRKAELEFNERKAVIIKENLGLKDRIESIQGIVAEKTEMIASLEKEKKSVENALDELKTRSELLLRIYANQIKTLEEKNASLTAEAAKPERRPIAELIKEALYEEDNDNVRKVLERALNSIELIKSGKSIELEPIIVAGKKDSELMVYAEEENKSAKEKPSSHSFIPEGETGEIISLDKRYKLIVINLGRIDNVRRAQRCVILRDRKETASGKIVSVRHRISAVFIDELHNKYSFKDIRKGDKVLMLDR